MNKIKRNRAKCKVCGHIIESKSRHDMVWCPCGAIAVDGGKAYLKHSAKDLRNIIDMTEYEMEDNKSAVRDIIVKSIVTDLEDGELTWHKYWDMADSPYNHSTCHAYTGLNRLILATRGYEDNRWVTASNANELGGSIDIGEEGTPVVWWHPMKVGEPGKKKTVPFMRYYVLYNVTQVEGMDIRPFKKSPQPRKSTAIKRAQEMVNNYVLPAPTVLEVSRETPTFHLPTDTIHTPLMEQFETKEGYWRALFHELAHSTGIESRLNRQQLDTDTNAYVYGREELIAEITTAFLCAHCGIMGGFEEEESDRINGWLEVLKKNPSLVISAASHAEKAYKFIIGEKE